MSLGEDDFVEELIEELGAEYDFGKKKKKKN